MKQEMPERFFMEGVAEANIIGMMAGLAMPSWSTIGNSSFLVAFDAGKRRVPKPAAGMTALRTLRRGEPLLGKRVLITGAAGGVGRLAVELALAAARLGGEVERPRSGADPDHRAGRRWNPSRSCLPLFLARFFAL